MVKPTGSIVGWDWLVMVKPGGGYDSVNNYRIVVSRVVHQKIDAHGGIRAQAESGMENLPKVSHWAKGASQDHASLIFCFLPFAGCHELSVNEYDWRGIHTICRMPFRNICITFFFVAIVEARIGNDTTADELTNPLRLQAARLLRGASPEESNAPPVDIINGE
jgi:hypothetical protein